MTEGQFDLFPNTPDDYPTSYLAPPETPVHITALTIRNFKRIEESRITMPPFTVLTGVNNSGKSTILQAIWVAFECLRLVVDRDTWRIPTTGRSLTGFDFLPSNDPRDLWYNRRFRQGNTPLPVSIRIDLSNGFHFEATIRFSFGAINVQIGDWNRSANAEVVKDVLALAPMLIPGHVEILAHEESRVPAQIHKHALSGQLSPIIRNVLLSLSSPQLNNPAENRKISEAFRFVADSIKDHFGVELAAVAFEPEKDLEIRATYKEQDWELDIVSAGSGLHQILKLVTFIAWRRARIVLLDEPDAHLHTSLQMRLAAFLQALANKMGIQFVIATHSRDLISQTPIESVIPVDSSARNMAPIDNIDHLLAEYRRIGPLNNFSIALLFQTKLCLFVEGSSEVNLLPLIATRLGYSIFVGTNQIVLFEFGGVDKFTMVKDLAELFQKVVGSKLHWAVLRDRDAATPRALAHFEEEAARRGIEKYHIWSRYSLENYMLEPGIVLEAVKSAAAARGVPPPDDKAICDLLIAACNLVKSDVLGSFTIYNQSYYTRHDLTANPKESAASDTYNYINSATDLGSMVALLPGAKVFGKFVQLVQSEIGVHVRQQDLLSELSRDNAPSELLKFLDFLAAMQSHVRG